MAGESDSGEGADSARRRRRRSGLKPPKPPLMLADLPKECQARARVRT